MKNLSGLPDRVYYSNWFWRPGHQDPKRSADVFARGVKNVFGRDWCVYASVTREEADAVVAAHNEAVRDVVPAR
jgi:hypothetical protein